MPSAMPIPPRLITVTGTRSSHIAPNVNSTTSGSVSNGTSALLACNRNTSTTTPTAAISSTSARSCGALDGAHQLGAVVDHATPTRLGSRGRCGRAPLDAGDGAADVRPARAMTMPPTIGMKPSKSTAPPAMSAASRTRATLGIRGARDVFHRGVWLRRQRAAHRRDHIGERGAPAARSPSGRASTSSCSPSPPTDATSATPGTAASAGRSTSS